MLNTEGAASGVAIAPVDLTAQLEAIDRQLLTRSPCALDFSLLLCERKSVYEALYPETRHGGDRRSQAFRDFKSNARSFCSDAAERLGVVERVVEKAVALGEAVRPFADTLRTTPIADNAAALRTFAIILTEDARAGLLGAWSDNPRLTFKAALIAARLRVEERAEDVQFTRLVDAWTRASARARKRFMAEAGLEVAS
jgi:ParB family transcriptional regulator, chromosome partitioning protein